MPAHKFIIKVHDKLQYYKVTLDIQAKLSGLK